MATAILQHHARHTHGRPRGGDLRMVLTPVQLAAVLQGASINPQEIFLNRVWGGAMLVGGALELVGGVALLLTPEPTMATKVGGGGFAAHGADTVQAGARQIYFGTATQTLTQQGSVFIAKQLGADEKNAERIGVAVEVAVPVMVGLTLGAARVAAIRAGRISLAAEEAAGGHTILKHVAKTEAELRARLLREAHIPAASSFASAREAEIFIGKAIQKNAP